MSLALKKRSTACSKKCAVRLWRLFPHVCLSLSLVGYAAVGALIFQHIEGRSTNTYNEEFEKFLEIELVTKVQNLTQNGSYTQTDIVAKVKNATTHHFKSIWLQSPERWNFFGSLFFCCTVFTTVGYGEIYPVTLAGKVVCILYAMVGIPLMLLVISDVGDLLAVLLSRVYARVHALCRGLSGGLAKALRRRTWSPDDTGDGDRARHRLGRRPTLEDGGFVFGRDAAAREPLDAARTKSAVLRRNAQIFQRIVAREDFAGRRRRRGEGGGSPLSSSLRRALSCPELDRGRSPPLQAGPGGAPRDLESIGRDMEQLDVPFVVILLVVFAYILFGGLILPLWEEDFRHFDPFYFCFITLTTIGFGDIVPRHPKYFMLTSLFIIIGMAIMSMAFKLGQSRIVSFYRQSLHFLSRGNLEFFQEKGTR